MRQFLGPALLPLAGAGAARQGVPLSGKGQMMQLHALLSQRQPEPPAGLPADEVAVFQDEVDINLNPKIGSMWMRRGQQAVVETPGDNEKRYLAGSMDLRTGTLWMTEGPHRDGELFVRHLEDLRLRLRRYRVMHVICDNAPFHRPEKCKRLQAYLGRWADRIVLHHLPLYARETNPIERVWWHLHDESTRNHPCQTMEESLDLVFGWLDAGNPFAMEGSVYPTPIAA